MLFQQGTPYGNPVTAEVLGKRVKASTVKGASHHLAEVGYSYKWIASELRVTRAKSQRTRVYESQKRTLSRTSRASYNPRHRCR